MGGNAVSRASRVSGRSNAVRAVNAEIALAATRMDRRPSAASEEWIFLCECGREGCAERVQLRLPEYRQLRGRSELPIVADAHTMGERAAHASRQRRCEPTPPRSGRKRSRSADATDRPTEASPGHAMSRRRRVLLLAAVVLVCALPAASPAGRHADPTVYSGLGSWLDIFATRSWSQPSAVIATLKARGARTL